MPRSPMAPWLSCVQISLPVAASTATTAMFFARRYITLSTTIGLNRYVRMSPVGRVHATCSCATFFLLIWSSEEYCDESELPRYCRQVLYFGLPFCCASGTATSAPTTSANPITSARRFINSPGTVPAIWRYFFGRASAMYCAGAGSAVMPTPRGANRPRPPPTQKTTNCRPPTSYTVGTPSTAAPTSIDHNTLPVSWSYARSLRSDEVPTKSSPPPVAATPPRGAKLPCSVLASGSPGISPFGTCQTIFPLLRSYAVICDQGGPSADKP